MFSMTVFVSFPLWTKILKKITISIFFCFKTCSSKFQNLRQYCICKRSRVGGRSSKSGNTRRLWNAKKGLKSSIVLSQHRPAGKTSERRVLSSILTCALRLFLGEKLGILTRKNFAQKLRFRHFCRKRNFDQ
jgi:hypothetical protein